MQPLLAAHFLPDLVPPEELAGGTVVVIDVLRASTTISHALAAGARAVIPAMEVDEARRIAAGLPAGEALLGGEREGLPIAGFDLGNSPSEFRPETVARPHGGVHHDQRHTGDEPLPRGGAGVDRRVRESVGGVRSAEVDQIEFPAIDPFALCRHRGRITREDVLFAGAVVDRLLGDGAVDESAQNDQARIARAAWREACGGELPISAARLAAELRDTQGGRNLKAIHLERDIDDVAKLDSLRVVPELNLAAWRIEPADMNQES